MNSRTFSNMLTRENKATTNKTFSNYEYFVKETFILFLCVVLLNFFSLYFSVTFSIEPSYQERWAWRAPLDRGTLWKSMSIIIMIIVIIFIIINIVIITHIIVIIVGEAKEWLRDPPFPPSSASHSEGSWKCWRRNWSFCLVRVPRMRANSGLYSHTLWWSFWPRIANTSFTCQIR